MKLRNKKTGRIIELNDIDAEEGPITSLAELNEEWEDYEEPKDYYFIRSESLTVGYSPISNTRSCRNRKEIGNYFETREEAEKVVEKLKAWKRLKDKGFEFTGWDRHPDFPGDFRITASDEYTCDDKDLDLLFGGEE